MSKVGNRMQNEQLQAETAVDIQKFVSLNIKLTSVTVTNKTGLKKLMQMKWLLIPVLVVVSADLSITYIQKTI